MLATGIRTPVGIKVLGKDLTELDQVAKQIETVVRERARHHSVYAERTMAAITLTSNPTAATRPLWAHDRRLQNIIAMALGGEPVTTTVEGRERYAVSLRYPRDYRSNPQAIARAGPGADAGRRRGAAW